MLKSTPEYKNHKKRFQAGYFPSKSRKKNQKKSKILDSIEGSGSVTAECKVIGDLYQGQTISLDVSNISGISSNSTMKWILNGITKDIDCDATHCWNNSMNAPSVPGNYDYVLTYNEKTVCAGTIKVVDPASNLTAECAITDNNNTEISAGIPSQQIKFKITNQNTSGTDIKLSFSGKKCGSWNNGICTSDADMVENITWGNNSTLESQFNLPLTVGSYTYTLKTLSGSKELCSVDFEVIEPGSNLTAECAITDNNNTEITTGALSQQIKFKVTNQNTSGNAVKLLLLGKESLWENSANINKDFVDTVWWNNGQPLENGFNLPLTVGTYTYTLKTLSGSKELCSVDFEVKGPEATCKFKYNDNYVTEVDGGTSNIYFDVSDVKNVANNYTAKLNFNGTSKAIDCGNSNCWNNSFNAPAAESEDKDHEFTLTTADGSHEICKATLTVKGTGGSGGGGGGSEFSCSSDNSISLGTLQGIDNAPNIAGNLNSNECYSLTLNGKSYSANLQIGNWSGKAVNVSFKDCNGNLQTKEVPSDKWNGYSISAPAGGNCTIYLLSTSGGNIQFNHW